MKIHNFPARVKLHQVLPWTGGRKKFSRNLSWILWYFLKRLAFNKVFLNIFFKSLSWSIWYIYIYIYIDDIYIYIYILMIYIYILTIYICILMIYIYILMIYIWDMIYDLQANVASQQRGLKRFVSWLWLSPLWEWASLTMAFPGLPLFYPTMATTIGDWKE